ncbi:APC family permease [Paenibacillus silvisoli]|uniref:APC family permease n=1 Tax=Paenibacillus silvisoli TaxID=3110539 RepID=UPI00280578EC|nr:APC family permease [Paenibacillus silvisoli]
MFLLWLGCLMFMASCALSLFIVRKAELGAVKSLHQSLHHYSPYVRYMQDKHDLNGIGFAQQLTRHIGGLSSAGIAFTALSFIGGALLLLGPAAEAGGPAVIGIGWPVLTFFGLITASALASLASAVPTAGGCYHWALSAGGRRSGLWTGWLHLMGTILLLVTTNLLLADWIYMVLEKRLGYAGGEELRLILILVLFITQALLNVRGVHELGRLAGFTAIVQLFVCMAVAIFLVAAAWPSMYPFQMLSGTASPSGGETSLVLGMLLLQRLFLGGDSIGQMAEETKDPRVNVPWSIFFSALMLGVFGYILFVIVMMFFPLGREGFASYLEIGSWLAALWDRLGAFLSGIMMLLILWAVWMNGSISIAAASRTLFAMARDEAAPFSGKLMAVSEQFRTPLRSVLAVTAAAASVAVTLKAVSASGVTPQSMLAQLAMLGIGAMHTAYALPIGAKLYGVFTNRANAKLKGPWHIGKYGTAVDMAAVCWLTATGLVAIAMLDPIVLSVLLCALLAASCIIEWKYRAMLKKSPFKVVGSIRFSRRSIDECIRIERKFPQQ